MAKFRTRARTVDMLGRQQIANGATAISELFKNAYDAYATHAEADYFDADGLLLIRDDGAGMTREEFENNWLVLATESKSADNPARQRHGPPAGMDERMVMGEKGIGRLAIALLGHQVLVMTRRRGEGTSHDLVMCFIHWRVFELPYLNLEDIDIPVATLGGGGLPSRDDVRALVNRFGAMVRGLRTESNVVGEILADLEQLRFDPRDTEAHAPGPSLGNGGSGTHFYIVSATDSIGASIKQDQDRDRQSKEKEFSKFLLGFANSTFGQASQSPIAAAFRHWRSSADWEDIIGEGEFFSPQELAAADHRVSGRFDEYGQFLGDVRIYDERITDYTIPWREARGKPTQCGPFELEFGYVMGSQRESRMPPEDWQRLAGKLDQIGGIYVYRNGIRILPYGNSDVDWLGIEERRTKGAAYYFFSYRRLFGAVLLTGGRNGRLREKAGREGFQQDLAYRQLKSLLENMFLQLAADFFRSAGVRTHYYEGQREELARLAAARARKSKLTAGKRRSLVAQMNEFFTKVDGEVPETEIDTLRRQVKVRMDSAVALADRDRAAAEIVAVEKDALAKLADISACYRVTKPRGLGFGRTLQREWEAYLGQRERLERELFEPFSKKLEEEIGSLVAQTKLYVDQRKRLEALIKQEADSGRQKLEQEARELRKNADSVHSGAVTMARKALQEMQDAAKSAEMELARSDFTDLSEDEVKRIRTRMEDAIKSVRERNWESLSRVREALAAVGQSLVGQSEFYDPDILEAMDAELLSLREEAEANEELVQVGLAIAVINHEFEAAIQTTRRSLQELGPWAAANEKLAHLYRDIRANFEHLDSHLSLFTPLQRRLYRKAVPVTGADIQHYVEALFAVRLRRHGIHLEATPAFSKTERDLYPSTIYPVFVNVIDNAIYWLKNSGADKAIRLDADDSGYIIWNSGPPISVRDMEAVFDLGFTRKPGGRGMGLYISRRALRKEGMDILALPLDSAPGATLKILWEKKDE